MNQEAAWLSSIHNSVLSYLEISGLFSMEKFGRISHGITLYVTFGRFAIEVLRLPVASKVYFGRQIEV
jgi:hypothetical protein